MAHLITTLGAKRAEEIGMILPHEHIFADLRTPDQPGYAEADTGDVLRLMTPEIERAKAAGVTALVECSAVGVGRRIDILKAVSETTKFPIVVPTGIYREPWVPQWARDASEGDLRDWMLRELTEQIDSTGVRAGWIKLSAGDDGLTPVETKILRAAASAAAQTNAVIGSHTIKARVVHDQLNILEQQGCSPSRFIWIHAQAERDVALHMEVARRGAWVEYDWIGGDWLDDAGYIALIRQMIDAGFCDHLLISHDRGWYDPAQQGGGTPKPFTYITERFIPALYEAGIGESTVWALMHENPFRAFAR